MVTTLMTLAEIERALPVEPLPEPPALPYTHRTSGKVREVYDLGEHLLIVATDRISAFDVILPGGIPGKGILLTQISLWWFAQVGNILPHHLADNHEAALAEALICAPELLPRSMLVKKLQPLPLEAVMRAYLAGSAWKAYGETGALWGHTLPTGLRESEALPQPLFTPTTKANEGHDLPITHKEARKLVGTECFEAILNASEALFALGTDKAKNAGLILADTKFEFGTDEAGKLYLIDEVLTPDSSRYWPADDYAPGRPQHAFDKQYVRDYLETLDWDKTSPGPTLPAKVIEQTRTRYLDALRQLMGTH